MTNNKTFIIAEAGVNHNGSLVFAKQLIDVAQAAGADAVKFQSFQAEELVSIDAPKAEYQQTAFNESQFEMLKLLELSHSMQIELQSYCKTKGILFLSSPFDFKSLRFLDKTLNIPLIKIASGEITNFPMLLAIAQTGKPVILSTGMSTLGDIEAALSVLAWGYLTTAELQPGYEKIFYSEEGQQILKEKVALLHCTSEYPAPFEETNLRVMQTLKQAFGLQVGYSDHTIGIAVAIAASACGAEIIEKHFTLDKTLPGPDHKASLSPEELKNMVTSIRQVELAMGHSHKIPTKSELKNRIIARKSLIALENIKKGDIFTNDNLGCKRPGNGVSPINFYNYKNKKAERNYEKDELIEV